MPILSNQGRTVPELPALTSGNIGNSDFLIIQNVASNSTKKSTITDFCTKAASIITKLNDLDFTGNNNSFTGSINNLDDPYSILTDGIPNIIKRIKVLNYIELGENSSVNSGFTSYLNDFTVNQTQKGGNTTVQFLGNGDALSKIDIKDYPDGLNMINTPLSAESISSDSFIGNLTGNVVGNINYTGGTGQSYFFNLNVDNQLTVTYTTINNADINGGTIDNSVIGHFTPSRITGSKILAQNGIKGNLTGNVIGDLVGNVDGNVTGDLSGNVNGTLNGNVNVSAGTSNILNLNVNNNLFAANSQLTTVDIDGGNVDDVVIGHFTPSRITGSKILAENGIKGNLTGNVVGNVTGNVTGNPW